MTTDLRTLSLGERLRLFPPFLCFALTRVRIPPMTPEEKRARLENRENRNLRLMLKRNGVQLPRKPQQRRMTIEEVAESFPKEHRWYIPQLTRKVDWDDVQLRDMLRFMDACKIDLLHIKQVRYELRNPKTRNRILDHLTEPQKREFAKLAREWRKLPKS